MYETLAEWLTCPHCPESEDITVKRQPGDRGGTEALVIVCGRCTREHEVQPV